MLADMQVLNLGEELLLDVHPTVTAMLVDRLREFVFTEDVTVEDRTTRWAAFGVHGPESARVVSDVVRPGVGDGPAAVGADEAAAEGVTVHGLEPAAVEPAQRHPRRQAERRVAVLHRHHPDLQRLDGPGLGLADAPETPRGAAGPGA